MKMYFNALIGAPRTPRMEAALEAFVAISAIIGGLSMITRPDGAGLSLSLSLLDGSMFHSFLWPGIFLAGVVGVLNLAGTMLTVLRSRSASVVSLLAGGSLIVFVVSENLIIHTFHGLQLVFLVLGTMIAALSLPRHSRAQERSASNLRLRE